MTNTENSDDPDVPIVCDVCGTRTRVALDELADTIERHNDQFHDGDSIAGVDPDLRDELANLVARDLDLL